MKPLLRLNSRKTEDDGMIFPLILGIFVLVLVIFLLVLEYMHFMTAFNQCDKAIERSVISIATQNWDNVYHGVREGYAGANKKEKMNTETKQLEWDVYLKTDNIMEEAIDIMGLEKRRQDDGSYIKKTHDGEILYRIRPHNEGAIVTNVGIEDKDGNTNVGTGKGLMVEVTYDIEVAWMAPNAWGKANPIKVARTVVVQYKPQY